MIYNSHPLSIEMDSINQPNTDNPTQELSDPNRPTAKTKKLFVPKTKDEIDKLSKQELLAYKIQLSKSKTDELKNELKQYQRRESRADRSAERSRETRELIIWGRFVKTQIKNHPDRKSAYMQIEHWMTQYLDNDRDRELLGFPLLNNSGGDEHGNN